MGNNKRGSGVELYNSPLFAGRTGFLNTPAAQRERYIQQMIMRNIAELAMNRFTWKNLPEHLDQRFIEKTMLGNGLVVFYWDDDFGKLLAVKAASSGYQNFMEWPTSYTIVGPGSKIMGAEAGQAFMTKTLSGFIPVAPSDDVEKNKRKGFPIWPNYLRQSELDIIEIYSTRLARTDRTLEINVANARRNKVIASTANQQLSMTNLARQMDEGIEVIQVKDSALVEQMTALDLGVNPDAFDKLSVLRTRWWNECMGLLGIDNANQDKKERLVASEVSANDGQTDSMRYVALNARREGIAHVNKYFDENIEIDFNVEVEKMAKQAAIASGVDPDATETPPPVTPYSGEGE